MNYRFSTVFVSLFFFVFSTHANERLHIAVASNFILPMKSLAKAFEQDHPVKLVVSHGSSGKLYAQIRHGAPFQLFFSADEDKPKRLQEQGYVVASETYASGALVLVSTTASADAKEVLLSGNFTKLAVANPKVAPYGLASMQVMKALELSKANRNKLVSGENISQVFQFVKPGNVDMAFIARSQWHDSLNGWQVPAELHEPIFQDMALLKRGETPLTQKHFLRILILTQ